MTAIPSTIRPLAAPVVAARSSAPAPAAEASTREERVNHFIDVVQDSTLQHLRYGAAAYAGGMAGAVLGSPLCTELGIRTGSLIAMFGGTAAIAGVGALAGYFIQYALDKRRRSAEAASGTPQPGTSTPQSGSAAVVAEPQPGTSTPQTASTPDAAAPSTASAAALTATPTAAAAAPPTAPPAPLPAAPPAAASASPASASTLLGLAQPAAPSAKSLLPTTAGDIALTLGAALQAMPNIAYPTIVGATGAEKELILSTLDSLPLRHATSVHTLQVADGLTGMDIGGVAHPLFSQARVVVDRGQLAMSGWGAELVTHETAHALDYSTGLGPVGSVSSSGPFGKGPFVSDYAKTDWLEDWAESDVEYHQDPAALKAMSPEKYALVDQAHHHVVDQALDRPFVRQVGHKMGDLYGAVPGLRMGVQLAGALIAPFQLHRGARLLETSLDKGDPALAFRAKMNIASGLMLLFPGASLAALGLNIAQTVVSSHIRSGDMSPEKADALADKVLAFSTGPLGMIGMVAGDELAKAGVERKARPIEDARVSPVSMLKGMLCTLGGSWVGAMAGAAVGATVAGPAGAGLGMYWGMIGGATVGLAGYGVYKARKAVADDGPLALTKDDKKFLVHTLGGPVAGGAAGTVAGVVGGQLLGAAVGGAIAGPAGAAVGTWVGRLGGAFAGSYGGAKVGAWAAGRLHEGKPEQA